MESFVSDSSIVSHDTSTYQPRTRGASITLADVAAQAGVSKVAVSVALNKSKSKATVSEGTRQRILEVARNMGYRPNAVARSLRQQRTNIIGFYNAHGYMLDASFPVYGVLLNGLQHGCEEFKKDLLMHSVFRASHDEDVLDELINGKIDGLVLYARSMTPLVEKLVEYDFPVVTVGNSVEGIPCVRSDDIQGGQLLAAHLVSRGYRRVLYRSAINGSPALQRRLNSFQEVAHRNSMTVILSEAPSKPGLSEEEKQILRGDKSQRPDVVVGYNDLTADDVVDYCREQGLRVPQDIAIAGYDGLPSNVRPARDLTSIDANWWGIGKKAVSILTDSVAGKPVPMLTVLSTSLKMGDTT